MLTFEKGAHQYRWNGNPVPNVTRVLASESRYARFAPEQLELARQKGEHVHYMIALDCRGDLDEGTMPDWMKPALTEWRRFLHQSGFKVLLSEQAVYSQPYAFAGTLDLFGELPDGAAMVDIKRSFLGGPTIGLQLAAYVTAAAGDPETKDLIPHRSKLRRFALTIREDQRFQIRPYTEDTDYSVFLAALTMYRWRVKTCQTT